MNYNQDIKYETFPFSTTCMCLGCITLSEVGKIEKDKCHMIPFTYGI